PHQRATGRPLRAFVRNVRCRARQAWGGPPSGRSSQSGLSLPGEPHRLETRRRTDPCQLRASARGLALRLRVAHFVRQGDATYDKVDEVPEQLRRRVLAVRAFDAAGMMVGFDLVDGSQLEQAIEKLFAGASADYLHVHFAAPGCYAARVERAP